MPQSRVRRLDLLQSCAEASPVWNRDTLHLTHNFPFQTGPVNCLSAQPDGQLFVSASGDGTIMLWDLNKCQLIKKLYQGAPGLACIAFTASVAIFLPPTILTCAHRRTD
jgi:WD40 repeat protein